jgi:GxxExxY protein
MRPPIQEVVLTGVRDVANQLGTGHIETAYANALTYFLSEECFAVRQEVPVPITFDGQPVGVGYADVVVKLPGFQFPIELKRVDRLSASHENQLRAYMRGLGTELGALINFGNPAVVEALMLIRGGVNRYEISWAQADDIVYINAEPDNHAL